MKERKYIREFCTERGAFELLAIIQANCPYKAEFRVEPGGQGLFVIRSNLLRGLPRDAELKRSANEREHTMGTSESITGKIISGSTFIVPTSYGKGRL